MPQPGIGWKASPAPKGEICMRRIVRSLSAVAVVVLTSLAVLVGDAVAAAIGPPMPWDGPLLMILASLSGTVAHVLITVAVIVTGLVFAFTEHGSGARRLFGVAFGGALALGALSFMTAVGWAGATF